MSMALEPSSSFSATTANSPPSTPVGRCVPSRGNWGTNVVTLTTNRRQSGSDQQWERDALVALRHGDVTPAVHAYVEHGRVTITSTIDQARQRIVEDWWSVHRTHTTAILAVRRSDVAALNDMVRARRQAAGELGTEIRMGAKVFSVGDRVIFEKNQRAPSADLADISRRPELVRLRNGTFGTAVALSDTGNAVTREGDVRRVQGDVAAAIAEEVLSEATRVSLVVQLDDGGGLDGVTPRPPRVWATR